MMSTYAPSLRRSRAAGPPPPNHGAGLGVSAVQFNTLTIPPPFSLSGFSGTIKQISRHGQNPEDQQALIARAVLGRGTGVS
jgi:hypothetical protein